MPAKEVSRLRVRSFPRLHFGLIDLAGVTQRRYGGSGVSIEGLPTEVVATIATANSVITSLLSDEEVNTATSIVERMAQLSGFNFEVQVASRPPSHVGLGSKTSLLMAVAEACNAACGSPITSSSYPAIVRRGGASGIGVHAFFLGGFLVDCGHEASNSLEFLPSSAKQYVGVPPVSVHCTIPHDWKFHLILPLGTEYSGSTEMDFFRRHTPIAESGALRALALVYHGLVPSFLRCDFPLLKQSIQELQGTGFKAVEIEGQPSTIRQLLVELNADTQLAAGMSSMGPLVYAISESQHVSDRLASIVAAYPGTSYLGCFSGRNSGFELEACC